MLSQQAHNIKLTSYQRWCDVITSHRRWYDVILTLCVHRVIGIVTFAIEPGQSSSYKRACTPNEDSDYHGHPLILSRTSAVRLKKTVMFSSPQSVFARADLSHCLADMWSCMKSCALAHFLLQLLRKYLQFLWYSRGLWVLLPSGVNQATAAPSLDPLHGFYCHFPCQTDWMILWILKYSVKDSIYICLFTYEDARFISVWTILTSAPHPRKGNSTLLNCKEMQD